MEVFKKLAEETLAAKISLIKQSLKTRASKAFNVLKQTIILFL
jgi:hypothetical protein